MVDKGLGIMPRHRFYRCTKCNKHVMYSEIEEERCPYCLNITMKHRDCGGIVIEWNFNDVKIR